LAVARDGDRLYAAHRWSGEVVRLGVARDTTSITARRFVGGEPHSLALGPREDRLYVALAASREIVSLHADSLEILARFPLQGQPWAVLPSGDERGLFIAEFDRDRILRLNAASGEVESTSQPVIRPACLARDGQRRLYAASFRTGEISVLDEQCRLLHQVAAGGQVATGGQLNQCRSMTIGPDGRLYAPQTRSDTLLGGRMFDRSVFPVVAVLDPGSRQLRIEYFPDLLVVPPHRPTEVAVDERMLYLASAGSDDVLAIDQRSGWARWHACNVGQEPGAVAVDSPRRRLYVLTVTGQEIVTLNSINGEILGRTRYAHDPTPPTVARGRYLFGTATDKRLTKDQWMSCAVCHPDGEEDGRQWDFGQGPLDTRSLRGCLRSRPLHFDAHLDEIQDTREFTRMVMAGQWFLSQERMHPVLGESNAGLDADLDALAEYVASLEPREPPAAPADQADLRAAGREIFFSAETGCAECHPPPRYTDSGKRHPDGRFVRHDVGTRGHCADERLRELDTPSLLGLHGSAPYLHDGRAETLAEIFGKFNPHDRHGRTSHLTGGQTTALCEFLRYLRPPVRTRTGDGLPPPSD
jgi:mono/diheme cytochrome c family protein